MFAEDIVLGAIKAGPSWFVGDHLLHMESSTDNPEEVARVIADCNHRTH